jgi:hypothetical protein
VNRGELNELRSRALPKNSNPKLNGATLTLGARTPSSANACAARASPKKTGRDLLVALRAQCGRGRPRSQYFWPHYYSASFWAQPRSSDQNLDRIYMIHKIDLAIFNHVNHVNRV